MKTLYEFRSMDEVLRAALDDIFQLGHLVSPRNMETTEVLGWGFRLTEPRARKIELESRHWSESLAIGELCWHLSGSDDVDFISYYSRKWASFSEDGRRIIGSCYGKRIFSEVGNRNQWNMVKEQLLTDPQSRRAVLTLHDTERDLIPAGLDQPCITTVQFLIRDGFLNCISTVRSNDVIWGLCYDAFFMTMLQELLASELNIRLGWYQHFANSLHIYKPFYQMGRAILAEHPQPQSRPMSPMSSIESLPNFLSVEAKLRKGYPDGIQAAEALPKYWRDLAQPLVRKHLRMQKASLGSARDLDDELSGITERTSR